jgi:hypothetical protein
MATISDFYSEKHTAYSEKFKKIKAKVSRFVWYRLFSFISIFVPVSVFGWNWPAIPLSIAALAFFLYMVKRSLYFEKQKQKVLVLKKTCEDEMLALQHKFGHFACGSQYSDPEHAYTNDLDILGVGSLFQYLNRTVTLDGEEKLATALKYPSKDKTEIEKQQEAIKELAQIPIWRLHFRANGKMVEETPQLNEEIKSWSSLQLPLKNRNLLRWFALVLPAATIMAAVIAVVGLSSFYLVVMVFIQILVMLAFAKTIKRYYDFFGRKAELLGKYNQLLNFVEEREFTSEYLVELQKKIKDPSAGELFKKLQKKVKEFEYRQNLLVGAILNAFLLWDVRCMIHLQNWHSRHHKRVAVWLDVLAEIDALVSMGNYAANHTSFVFPEIHEGGFTYSAKDLGHPLLTPQKCVTNNLEINGWGKIVIITGANMAGKSTFLRIAGINLVLARMGAPVFASSMRVSPIALFSNMRTTDSLLKDESYFFAELKRLKTVLERMKSGERVFVILDEMLKGTNSVDKLNGSKKLVDKLLDFRAVAIVATHDLKLSEMENKYPQQVFNQCFEIQIENNEMVFTYKLSDGVTKTMNATFLMKKMGII